MFFLRVGLGHPEVILPIVVPDSSWISAPCEILTLVVLELVAVLRGLCGMSYLASGCAFDEESDSSAGNACSSLGDGGQLWDDGL